jgi:hypothetical protein
MKTEIIQLELFDNRYSIRDRIEWSRASRILLVWPKRGRLVLTDVDLIEIELKVKRIGAQLALICRDLRIKESAAPLNISVFPSLSDAEGAHWQTNIHALKTKEKSKFWDSFSERRVSRGNIKTAAIHPRVYRGMAIFLGSLAILSLLIYLLPSAKIILYPQTYQKSINVSIWASTQVHEININGNLPALEKQVEVSDSEQGASTGTVGIPDSFAKGQVTFTNLTDSDISLPKGTIIITGNEPVIRYLTDEAGILPAGNSSSISIRVTAEAAGAAGNQPAGSLTSMEGNQGASVTVTNELSISGGTDQQAPSPTDADYAQARQALLSKLKQGVSAEISTTGDVFIPDSLSGGEVVSEVRSLEVGQPGGQFTLTMTAKFSGLVYRQKDLDALVQQVMTDSLSNNEVNYDGKVYSSPDPAIKSSISADGVKWQEIVSANLSTKSNLASLAGALAGKSKQKAVNYLQNHLSLSKKPGITNFPFDWQLLPLAGFRIQIEVQS